MQASIQHEYCKKSLHRLEKLKSRKTIEILFKEGVSNKKDCIQAIFTKLDLATGPQVMFSVPKSKIQKANIRNTIKRRMREAYRLNKNILHSTNSLENIALAFIFTKKAACKYSAIEESIITHLNWIRENSSALKSKIKTTHPS